MREMFIRNTFNTKNYWLDIQSHLKLSPFVEEGVCTEYMYVYSAHCLLYKSVSMYCLYVNCFCTVWSTLSRISLTNAQCTPQRWCDNKSDLIWFEVQVQEWMTRFCLCKFTVSMYISSKDFYFLSFWIRTNKQTKIIIIIIFVYK